MPKKLINYDSNFQLSLILANTVNARSIMYLNKSMHNIDQNDKIPTKYNNKNKLTISNRWSFAWINGQATDVQAIANSSHDYQLLFASYINKFLC